MIKNILIFEFRNLAHSLLSLAGKELKIEKEEKKEKINFFFGKNASGKTSVLEAIYLLKYQKSFRAKNLEQCIRKGSVFFGLKFEINGKKIFIDKHIDAALKIKLDNEYIGKDHIDKILPVVELLSEHYENLVIGQVEIRRKFIDEIMFHMEPEYKNLHKSYQKYLESRNHLLKTGRLNEDDFYIRQMAEIGEQITEIRERNLKIYLENLKENLSGASLSSINFEFKKGYSGNLLACLEENRELDRLKKSTSGGAHKCDIAMLLDGERCEYFLSRGQIKLLNMALILAKIDLLAKSGDVVVMLIDDYFAEMDDKCLQFLLNWLKKDRNFECQIFENAVSEDEFKRMHYLGFKNFNLFEVEDGKISQIA